MILKRLERRKNGNKHTYRALTRMRGSIESGHLQDEAVAPRQAGSSAGALIRLGLTIPHHLRRIDEVEQA